MDIVVFSGGTATNSLTHCFNNVSIAENHELTYVLPISDNGGSTSEILRVFGGPAIGDIRSRIVRVIQDEHLAKLFGYRLSSDPVAAKAEWNDIVDGSHQIWSDIPMEVKEMCRSFIIHVHTELLKKSKSSNKFQFGKASIGNLFLTGARLFMGSLDASIELMLRIGRCSQNIHVIPCINTNHTHHISALLTNGDIITGQSQISHPSPNANNITTERKKDEKFVHILKEEGNNIIQREQTPDHVEEEEEYAYPLYILPELKNSQLYFNKDGDGNETKNVLLPAPIKKILYINPYGEEIKPVGNSRVISRIKSADMIVYSIGSLMTSLLPIIILGNIAETIVKSPNANKVLIINNKHDRETVGLDGLEYVKHVIESMVRSIIAYRQSKGYSTFRLNSISWDKFVTDIIYLKKGEIQMNWQELHNHNIKCHCIDSDILETDDLESVLRTIQSERNRT
ncbi:hypothetical protein KAFR_0H03180 [Kazachstania africana CBS 2517]|uniref:Uncharacterized protein n=1 Tax=Kazachstania africana (strain ATCC 22294 / BCRC 22015 / CBS 2517 / CECT 1963 / NBRC 1671 / NRRL Y-8276) TaxID=1071382 RepID=H2AZH2_KAZAF|nr:hypothetical protein KAFR_0H03180 [Kazachstania africana CBS 2517]CCF59728.1 hypothetical protein KAFR_0H03180 [Kazachstania africana CBS 2517]